MALTKHCHKCGWEWPLAPLPGRNDSCHQCGSDMKCCLNCSSYDPRVAHQCKDRRTEPVAEKHTANFCEYFEFLKSEWKGATTDSREAKARDQLKKLFGD
ncbi:MAG: hypothetical protein FJ405_11835 [Verrucomicrobia bacterium]|nr:hypothetical protein [Verrucomicrobiota bacterium]